MTRAYVVTLRDGRAAPCEGTLYATPLVPLARELARLDLDAVSVAEEQHTRAEWLAAHKERMAYRCHACGAPDESAPPSHRRRAVARRPPRLPHHHRLTGAPRT